MLNSYDEIYTCYIALILIGCILLMFKGCSNNKNADVEVGEKVKKILVKYYTGEPELVSILEKCIKIVQQYYSEIFTPNPIYEKVFLVEVLQALLINTTLSYSYEYNETLSTTLKSGVTQISQLALSEIIPTLSPQYIEDCYNFRAKEYLFLFNISCKKQFLTEAEVPEQYHNVLFTTLVSHIKIFYSKDIKYFSDYIESPPLVNEKVFNKLSYDEKEVSYDNNKLLEMMYLLYEESGKLGYHLNSLQQQEQELTYKIRKALYYF